MRSPVESGDGDESEVGWLKWCWVLRVDLIGGGRDSTDFHGICYIGIL